MQKLFSVSICGLATLNLHSLNNEGGEGNHIQTRMVDIVDAEGRLHPVNAISGDMFKRIFVEHFYNLARNGAGLTLSVGSQTLNPNRLNVDLSQDTPFAKAVADADNEGIANLIVQSCALSDVAGILITRGNRSIGRKSIVEFSWVTGIPEKTKTESFFHVKYDPQSRGKTASEAGESAGQAIFHRPASSGQYAAVLNVEAYRIGFNDITQQYAIEAEERAKRYKAVMQAVMHTFLEPNGAMRNTQNPHITDFTGVVTTSAASVPAPTVSPINPAFKEQVTNIVTSLNPLANNALTVHAFDSLAGFAQVMSDLIRSSEPATFGAESAPPQA